MSHSCDSLILHCIDFRLQKPIKNYLEDQRLLGECDIVSIAGGAQNLHFLLQQVSISKRLHDIKKVILINHTDCGAYGGAQAFKSENEEVKHHKAELEKAKGAILSKFPGLEIKTLVLRFSREFSI